ncbi:haloacid dehalogenase-like hydrolase domain-containing 5 [Stigmatopora argus]
MQSAKCLKSGWKLFKSGSEEAARHYGNISTQGSFGLLFDIDGVLVRGRTPIPAAKRCFQKLVDRRGQYKVPVVFVTNAGNGLRRAKAEHLSSLLEVEVSPEQVMLSHSPLRMFTQFHQKCVLVSGQGPIPEVARALGFQNVVTIDQVREGYPLLDIVDHDRRPKDTIPPTKGLQPIDAVILFGEPIRWETNLQLILDVLLTGGRPDRNWDGAPSSQVPLLACNMDLLWMAEAKNPRFGHGTFLACLESLYEKVTGQELKYEALIGKPSVLTYNYAELLLKQQAQKLGWSSPVQTIYAIGDNPMADIYGANLYDRSLRAAPRTEAQRPEACHSILVCTGVYSKEEAPLPDSPQRAFHGHRDFAFEVNLTRPSYVVEDVQDAVELAFEREGRPLC